MSIAEIRGKISATGSNLSERMEDLLTSDILGCMRYLPAQKVLIPFLQRARSLYGNTLTIPGEVLRVHYSFWPWLGVRKELKPVWLVDFGDTLNLSHGVQSPN